MGYINPYIEKVHLSPRIYDQQEMIRSHQGAWSSVFGNDHPIHLEIGTGLGNFFSQYAQANPDINLVGMEIKYKRLWRTLEKCEKIGRSDVILLKEYGEKISEIFGAGELAQIFLFFPDPWPKKRHFKNRILQPSFLDSLHEVLASDGIFHFKTDHEGYFEWGKELFASDKRFEMVMCDDNYEADKQHSHLNSTEFEMIWREQGKKVMYLQVSPV